MVEIDAGAVITKYGHSQGELPHTTIIEAGHPVPDENGLNGTAYALSLVANLTAQDTVLFLVSGGGSALFEQLLPGVTLSDLEDITAQLLRSGASIGESNTLRKRLSGVKAGRFAQACAPAHVLSIVLSDVLGDPLDSIASGPAYPDARTAQDALRVVEKYNLRLPPHILPLLSQETPKALDGVETVLVGNVQKLCTTAAETAQALGYTSIILATTLDCEAREVGRMMAAMAKQICTGTHAATPKPPCAIIAGGETVVHVQGNGLGGRNQELALAAVPGIAGLPALLFSIGSDGTDGPTDAAGCIVDGQTLAKLQAAGISVDDALADNDAYHALAAVDGLILTGPTGTNVNDVCVLLCK